MKSWHTGIKLQKQSEKLRSSGLPWLEFGCRGQSWQQAARKVDKAIYGAELACRRGENKDIVSTQSSSEFNWLDRKLKNETLKIFYTESIERKARIRQLNLARLL